MPTMLENIWRRILLVTFSIITVLLELLPYLRPHTTQLLLWDSLIGLTPVLIAVLVAILQAIAPTDDLVKFGLMLFIGSVINTTNYFGMLS